MSWLVTLLLLGSVPKPAKSFQAETAKLSLPVPKGWDLDAEQAAQGNSPLVPAAGKSCVNSIWFDFIPAATKDYTLQLIATESLDATSAIRQWDVPRAHDLVLADHPATCLEFPSGDLADRSVYLVPAHGGVLLVQVMAEGHAPEDCRPLQPALAETLVAEFFAPSISRKAQALSSSRSPPPLNKLEAVPATLEECFASLNKQLDPKDIEAIRTGPERGGHFGLGMSIRNAWGLWGDSPLAKMFQAKGVFQPENMSAVIITSFWRHLNGKPLQVDEQIAAIHRFTEHRTPPKPRQCPNGQPAQYLFGLSGDEPPDWTGRYVHVFACQGPLQYWAFEAGPGWSQPEGALRKRIDQLSGSPGLREAPLEEGQGGTITQLPNILPVGRAKPPSPGVDGG